MGGTLPVFWFLFELGNKFGFFSCQYLIGTNEDFKINEKHNTNLHSIIITLTK